MDAVVTFIFQTPVSILEIILVALVNAYPTPVALNPTQVLMREIKPFFTVWLLFRFLITILIGLNALFSTAPSLNSEIRVAIFQQAFSFSNVFKYVPAGPEYSTDLPLTVEQHKLAQMIQKYLSDGFVTRVIAITDADEDVELFHVTPASRTSDRVRTIQWSKHVQNILEQIE